MLFMKKHHFLQHKLNRELNQLGAIESTATCRSTIILTNSQVEKLVEKYQQESEPQFTYYLQK